MLFKNKYAQAFAIAAYVGTVSALGVYFTALTQGLDWRQMLSIVGTSFIMPFAALSKALPDPLHPQPQITVDHVQNMPTTVTTAPPPPARTRTGQFASKMPPDLSISDH